MKAIKSSFHIVAKIKIKLNIIIKCINEILQHLVGQQQVTDNGQVLVGEDEPDVATDVGHKGINLRVLIQNSAQTLADESVFTHQNFSLAAKSKAVLNKYQKLMMSKNKIFHAKKQNSWQVIN